MGRSLAHYVQREFDNFLKCGILEHGFLRDRCQDCHSERVGANLEREGLLARDIYNTYLQIEAPDESAIDDLLSHCKRGRRD